MRKWPVEKLLPGIIAPVAVVAVVVWMGLRPATPVGPRVPGTDRTGSVVLTPTPGPISGTLTTGDGLAADLKGAWPCFRGELRDGVARQQVSLASGWAGGTPEALWRIDVGEGYAAAAIRNGCVYLIDYDRPNQADTLRCLSLADGKEIWRYSYPVKVKRNHGMSRTVPAVTDRYVVSMGPKCHVLCLDSTTGESRWLIDLVQDHGTTVPPWYAGQCPLIDGDRAIIAPGGPDALMIAVDCNSPGKVVWRTPNPYGWRMTHSSIVPMTLDGRKTYVYCASAGVAGIAADDGSILWTTNKWQVKIANVPSPVAIPGGRLFLTGGYDAGSMMLQIGRSGNEYSAEVLFRLDAEVFGAAMQTPILFNGLIYGIRPDGQLTCLDLEGDVRWTSGAAAKFGGGPLLIAADKLFAMDDHGVLTLAEVDPNAFRPLGVAPVVPGRDSWAPMAIANGRLIVRNMTEMVCLDVSAQ